MGSTGNPNPWDQYDSYRDCSQGVCSVYCPQWCYIIFPPPPSLFLDDEDDSSSSSDFSPLLIALIGILASAFILVTYYTLVSKHCHRSSTTSGAIISSSLTDTWQRNNGGGLDETLIKSIEVYRYRKEDGFVESSDCAVCLSEFEEDESLRLLPKCSHAFHVPCIDTWLKSHSNCPLCRAGISVTVVTNAVESVAVSNQPNAVESAGIETVSIDSVVVNLDLETGSRDETVVVANVNGGSTPKPPELQGDRSSGDVVLIADILREIEEDEESAGVGTSRRVEDGEGEKTPPPSVAAGNQVGGGISNFLARSYGRARNYRLPN